MMDENKRKVIRKKSIILIAGGILLGCCAFLYRKNRTLERNYYKVVGENENLKDMLCGYQKISERNAFSLGKMSRELYKNEFY